MADFLYNGVELPDIKAVWDKETYPFVVLNVADATSFGFSGQYVYRLLFTSVEMTRENDGLTFDPPSISSGYYANYFYADSVALANFVVANTSFGACGYDGVWAAGESKNTSITVEFLDAFGQVPTWSNYDVLYTSNGTVYLAASTPTRVDSKLKISVGSDDGLLLFDGTITENAKGTPLTPFVMCDVGDTLEIEFDGVLYTGTFQALGTGGIIGDLSYKTYPFCLAASPAVTIFAKTAGEHTLKLTDVNSKGGKHLYNGVELPGLQSLSLHPYKALGFNTQENTYMAAFSTAEFYIDASGYGRVSADANVIVYIPHPDGTMWAVYDADNYTSGTYFFHTSVFSAKWSAFDIMNEDGSVYLAASDPVPVGGATDTTATAVFTCTNLENTEPIDCIKAWVYKKSDGLNTTITPTWTSEMFSAPEYSTTHTFTGLTPNTEYEVYGCIFVNGEATDHNAVAEFTTLESDEEPLITETSGDGFALYNGVKLPNIDSVWTDKATYPYAFIMPLDFVPGMYQLQLSTGGCVKDGDDFVYTADGNYKWMWLIVPSKELDDIAAAEGVTAAELVAQLGLEFNAWGKPFIGTGEGVFVDGGFLEIPLGVTWSNFDILNTTDNTVYLAASDPIPLDGYTVIEWNGGTAGLTNSGTGLYKITDEVLASNQVIGGVFVQNVSSKLTAIRVTSDVIEAYESGIRINAKIYSAPANALMPEAGTYFVKLVGDYVSLFAYPNAADLKPVYKRVGGVWVKKTAYERQNGEWVLISTAEEVQETATMLYNGVELPNINAVWTDKESYPYATILGKTTISLILHNPEFRHKTGSFGELCLMTESGSITGWVNYSYNASTASWKRWSGPFGGQSPEFKDSTQPAIWSNYDVLNTDGSVYLAASDPVPVT